MKIEARGTWKLRDSHTQPLPPWATGTEEKSLNSDLEPREGTQGKIKDYGEKREVEAGGRLTSLLLFQGRSPVWMSGSLLSRE